MKSKVSKVASLLLVFSFVAISLISTMTNASGFSDLSPKHWCYEKIMNFLDKGYVCGYEDGTFKPDQTITRAEYVKIVNNFFGYSENKDTSEMGFSDVSENDWFAGYVAEAVERGYITGYPDGTFRPQEPIRRQEATVILSRILNIDEEVYPEDHVDGMMQYSDGDEIEEWAYVAVHSYSVYNFINGYTDGTIKILQNVTRAETVELLNLLEEKIVIEKDETGGSTTRVSKVKTPIINAYENISGEKVLVEGWVNSETSNFEIGKGSLIEMTCETPEATIYYTIDNGAKDEYKEEFILGDGKHLITAWGEKKNRSDSSKTTQIVNVDTVPPVVYGVNNVNTVTVSVKDYDFYNVKELSGVKDESLEYAWFIFDEDKNDYVRESTWTSFENNSEIAAPKYPGIYYLGVKGSDIAENKIGTGFYQKNSNIDDEVDFPNGEDENPTGEPFVIITEIEEKTDEDTPSGEVSGENSGDNNPSGEVSGDISGDVIDEEIIEIVVDSAITIIHNFDDLPESGDIKEEKKAKPGTEYGAEALMKEEYPFVENYTNNADDLEPIIVSRNSGDNIVTIDYTRIKISVIFDGNGATTQTAPMPDDFIVPAGESKILPANTFIKEGHDFIGWSGDNGELYEASGDSFEAKPSDDTEVILSAIWKAREHTVIVLSGDYIASVGGTGKYAFGTEVEISAILEEIPGYNITFEGWSGDIEFVKSSDDFDADDAKTSFIMPDCDLIFEPIAKKTVGQSIYKVQYWLETFVSGDFVEESGDRLENEKADTDTEITDKKLEKYIEEYEGFEYDETLTQPSGKKVVTGDGKLVIKLYYRRQSYSLNVTSGDHITEVTGSGTYKYGEIVKIAATVEEENSGDTFEYTFGSWTGDTNQIEDDDFDKEDNTTSFKMPASDVELTANAIKIDVNLGEIIVKGYTDSSEKYYPDPGDIVKYSVSLTNPDQKNPVTVTIKVTAPSGDVLELEGKENTEEVTVTLKPGEKTDITFEVGIDPNFPVSEDFKVLVEANLEDSEKLLDDAEKTIVPQKTATINYTQKTEKNIVILVDLSGSMGFCTEHLLYTKENKVYLGEDIDYSDVKDGESGIDYDASIVYSEDTDFVFDKNGDIILDYTLESYEPWKNHGFVGDTKRCTADARIDIVIEALRSDSGFIKTLASKAAENNEELSITLVSFCGFEGDTNYDVEHSLAMSHGTFNLTDEEGTLNQNAIDTLCKNNGIIDKLRYGLHAGTAVNTGFTKVLEVKETLPSGDNVEDYLIFFGDGLANAEEKDIGNRSDLIAALVEDDPDEEVFDYIYAIGFGKDFEDGSEGEVLLTSLLKNTGDEPYKAESASDVMNAFHNIALAISSTTQTKNGILTISGESFEKAVNAENNAAAVFPIAIMDGDEVLFEIESESTESPVIWKDGAGNEYETKFKFIYKDNKLNKVEIDLSGTAFSNRKDLKVVLDYSES